MKIRGAIFDLDGTLLDSMGIWDTIATDYLRSCGVMPHPDVDDAVRILSMEDAAQYFIREYGLTRTVPEIVQEVSGLVTDFYRLHVQLKPGAAALLASLARRGVKLCAATSGDGTLARAALARCGILPLLGRVFTCAEVGHGKDSPEIYEAARAYLGTSVPETAVFEDALHALQTAKRAGFFTVAVADPSARRDSATLRLCADVYLNSLTEWAETSW